jgi:flagellar hook-associated protein 2
MADISFGGLATGLDTDSIISGLMEVERQPLERLENDKSYQQARLEAFQTFDTKLDSLLSSIEDLSYSTEVRSNQVAIGDSSYFSATASGAEAGSYQIDVNQLAQVQKSVSSSAYSSQSDAILGTGDLTLTVGEGVVSEGAAGTDYTISITEDNNSLSGIRDAINAGTDDHGVTASIIDNGNEGGDRYYLVLTGADSSDEFELSGSLTGGQDLALDAPVQSAQEAQVTIDGIEVTSTTNTIENAISGVTLNLDEVSTEATTLTISGDPSSVVSKIEDFVSTYNDIMSFIQGQSVTEDDSSSGILLGDFGINSVKRNLQNFISTQVANDGTYKSLAEMGLSTQRDGTLELDTDTLNEALSGDFDSVVEVFTGSDAENLGVFQQIRGYLNDVTHTSTGLLATKETSIEARIEDIDDRILNMQDRLDRKEQMYEDQFIALEAMVAEMNSQSDYLTQQMDALSGMNGGN